jgi:hypothetical protein
VSVLKTTTTTQYDLGSARHHVLRVNRLRLWFNTTVLWAIPLVAGLTFVLSYPVTALTAAVAPVFSVGIPPYGDEKMKQYEEAFNRYWKSFVVSESKRARQVAGIVAGVVGVLGGTLWGHIATFLALARKLVRQERGTYFGYAIVQDSYWEDWTRKLR